MLLPHVVIYPGVTVGRDFFAHAHAVVREGCVLGDRVILQNGVVVGGDGFGFAKRDDGSWQKIPQSGPVRIGIDVEIQANACIDRASVGATVIADGAKIDNLVQVGHGSSVGENTLLCAQVGLAGSTEVGRNVVLAGQVGCRRALPHRRRRGRDGAIRHSQRCGPGQRSSAAIRQSTIGSGCARRLSSSACRSCFAASPKNIRTNGPARNTVRSTDK